MSNIKSLQEKLQSIIERNRENLILHSGCLGSMLKVHRKSFFAHHNNLARFRVPIMPSEANWKTYIAPVKKLILDKIAEEFKGCESYVLAFPAAAMMREAYDDSKQAIMVETYVWAIPTEFKVIMFRRVGGVKGEMIVMDGVKVGDIMPLVAASDVEGIEKLPERLKDKIRERREVEIC